MRAASTNSIDLQKNIDTFRFNVEKHLPQDGKGVVFTSAWLVSDNAIVALLHDHFPEVLKGMDLVGVDTLHLFPETHDVTDAVQAKYKKTAKIYKPKGLSTRADFNAKYGDCESLNHADFDLYSKVEPFQRALDELNKDILITGRRMDQGSKRIKLDFWENDKRVFNPIADWSWETVLAYVDKYDVPFNKAHQYVYRANEFIPPVQRHLPNLPWQKVDLGKPYWRATAEELAGSPPAKEVYVSKSFGDFHTSTPVYSHQSERAGRFVRYANSECGIHTRVNHGKAPHGGNLVNKVLSTPEEKVAAITSANKTLELNERQACDVELLITGGFSPLEGFMDKREYDHVVEHMRLPEQQLFGLPVTLDVDADTYKVGDKVSLQYKGNVVAVLSVNDVYKPNKVVEAKKVFGTSSLEHPGVEELVSHRGSYYLGGSLAGIDTTWFGKVKGFKSPAEVRKELPEKSDVVAFQCRNPIHRAHYELIRNVQKDIPGSHVLIHPTCGPTQPGDIDGETRIKTYEALANNETKGDPVNWAYLPYSMLMAGPREAIQHIIIRKNFGANYFIIGRDMAGTKSTIDGVDFYGPYDAQEIAKKHSEELGVKIATYENVVYTDKGFLGESVAKKQNLKPWKLSGTEFRRLLRSGEDIPDWFAFKSVIDVLRGDEATEEKQKVVGK